jgi:hypothetical protein
MHLQDFRAANRQTASENLVFLAGCSDNTAQPAARWQMQGAERRPKSAAQRERESPEQGLSPILFGQTTFDPQRERACKPRRGVDRVVEQAAASTLAVPGKRTLHRSK